MTREELLDLVNGKVDTTKFNSLSQKTINEELDDVLEDFGDDDDANDKIVTKLANRLKRMDGNLHKNVSSEIKKAKEEAERKKKEEEDRKRAEQHKDGDEDDDKYQKLLDKIESLEKANAERDKKAAKKATVESVKKGLKDKFDKANLEVNDFFLETALNKLEIPDDDVDVIDLVSKAESIYTSDYKRANGGNAVPKKGGTSHAGENKTDDHEWDDVIERRKKRFGRVDEKK